MNIPSAQETGTKCIVCVDKSIMGTIKPEQVNTAITWAPLSQQINVGINQVIPFVNVVPVCLGCRREQMGRPTEGDNGSRLLLG